MRVSRSSKMHFCMFNIRKIGYRSRHLASNGEDCFSIYYDCTSYIWSIKLSGEI